MDLPKTKQPVVLRKKSNSWLMRLAGWFLRPFTPAFMDRFWTTRGHIIYTPTRYDADENWGTDSWKTTHATVLRHEVIHILQHERWGALIMFLLYSGPSPLVLFLGAWQIIGVQVADWSWWVPGSFWLAAVVLAPLSLGFAWGRWRVEREAYLTNIRARTDPKERAEVIEWIVNSLWKNYLWTWPRSWMRAWFEENTK